MPTARLLRNLKANAFEQTVEQHDGRSGPSSPILRCDCATWTKINDGKEGCYIVVKEGNVYLIAIGETGEVTARAIIPPKS